MKMALISKGCGRTGCLMARGRKFGLMEQFTLAIISKGEKKVLESSSGGRKKINRTPTRFTKANSRIIYFMVKGGTNGLTEDATKEIGNWEKWMARVNFHGKVEVIINK